MARYSSPEQQQLDRRQRLADLLTMQAAQPMNTGTQMAGGWAIPNSPVAPFEKLGQALIARGSQQRVERDQTAYDTRRQEALAKALKSGDAQSLMENPDTMELGFKIMLNEREAAANANQSALDRRAKEDTARLDRMGELERARLQAEARAKAARIAAEGRVQASQVGGGGQLPSAIQVYEYVSGLDPKGQELFFKTLRGQPTINQGDQIVMPNPADPSGPPSAVFPVNPKPSEMPGFKAEVATAVSDAEAAAKAARTAQGIGDVIAEAESLLSGEGGNLPTASALGTGVDKIAGVFGSSPDGAAEAAQLRAIGGALLSKMPRMEGPQGVLDVKLYEEMAGRLGDSTVPLDQRRAALETVKKLYAKYAPQNPVSATGQIVPTPSVDDILNKYPESQ